MIAALLLPKLLDTVAERQVMLTGALVLVASLVGFGLLSALSLAGWLAFYTTWLVIGFSYSIVLTPSGRLLRRSCHQEDRPLLFAAQFALSHACWLLTYPLAGWIGAVFGMTAALAVLAGVAALSISIAYYVWPANDPEVIVHRHTDLPADHPHLTSASSAEEGRYHAHSFVIDELHRRWPNDA